MSERSKRILKSIENSGLSYGELAKITKIPKSALQRYATGETEKVPIDRIELIASATRVTATYLMGWEDTLSDESTDLEYEMSHDKLLRDFYFYWKQLSDTGKKKIIDNVSDLAKIYKNDTE